MTSPLTYTANIQPNGDVTIVLGNWTGVYQRGSQQVVKATNGVCIYSCYTPEWSPGENFLYVHGRTACADHTPIHIPAADWQRVEQALDEYGAVQTNAERAEEAKVYQVIETDTTFDVGGPYGCALVARLEKRAGCTRADADELCAKLTARAEAERKATEVRVDRENNALRLYIGDRKNRQDCASIYTHPDYGLTPAQADQLADATADALRKILSGEGAK